MIRSTIQFGDGGSMMDLFDSFGIVHLESDSRFGAPFKDYETTSYPEEAGEHIYPKNTLAPFDYKVKFLVMCDKDKANGMIQKFNRQLYQTSVSGIISPRRVFFFNAYKKVTIVGYPSSPLSEATSYYSKGDQDLVIAEFTIRVDQPELCVWDSSMQILVSANQQTLSVSSELLQYMSSNNVVLASKSHAHKCLRTMIFKYEEPSKECRTWRRKTRWRCRTTASSEYKTPVFIKNIVTLNQQVTQSVKIQTVTAGSRYKLSLKGRGQRLYAETQGHHRAYVKFCLAKYKGPGYPVIPIPNTEFKYNIDHQGNRWFSL